MWQQCWDRKPTPFPEICPNSDGTKTKLPQNEGILVYLYLSKNYDKNEMFVQKTVHYESDIFNEISYYLSFFFCKKVLAFYIRKPLPIVNICHMVNIFWVHKGNTIKVRVTNKLQENVLKELKQLFGPDIFELYGIVKDLEFDEEDQNKVFYKVQLAQDYNWSKDHFNRIISDGKLRLEEPTHTVTLSESEVTSFKRNQFVYAVKNVKMIHKICFFHFFPWIQKKNVFLVFYHKFERDLLP